MMIKMLALVSKKWTDFIKEEDGQALVEYSLIFSFIILVALVGLSLALKPAVSDLWSTGVSQITDAIEGVLGN